MACNCLVRRSFRNASSSNNFRTSLVTEIRDSQIFLNILQHQRIRPMHMATWSNRPNVQLISDSRILSSSRFGKLYWKKCVPFLCEDVSKSLNAGLAQSRRFSKGHLDLNETSESRHQQTREAREDEKTKITIINEQRSDQKIFLPYVYKYSKIGFNIGNNKVLGSVALLPGGILSWKVVSHHQITPESLSLFTIVQPKLEILILGVGDKVVQMPTEIWKFSQDHGFALEVLDTPNACATYNFLTEEGRRTAAALIPPQAIKL